MRDYRIMAYSDYGGYAYRNGERVEKRSDVVLSPEGIESTPGQWPGWTIEAGRNGGSYHALLGDGPIFVGLYKQSSLSIRRGMDELELIDCLDGDTREDAIVTYGAVRYIDEDVFTSSGDPCLFEVDSHKITVYWRITDNHYQYVRLEQPDGTVWTGFSGYGVGAGLEECGYGFSTDDQVSEIREVFA